MTGAANADWLDELTRTLRAVGIPRLEFVDDVLPFVDVRVLALLAQSEVTDLAQLRALASERIAMAGPDRELDRVVDPETPLSDYLRAFAPDEAAGAISAVVLFAALTTIEASWHRAVHPDAAVGEVMNAYPDEGLVRDIGWKRALLPSPSTRVKTRLKSQIAALHNLLADGRIPSLQ